VYILKKLSTVDVNPSPRKSSTLETDVSGTGLEVVLAGKWQVETSLFCKQNTSIA